jgi:mono/diheme cytochrome c family protein
MLCRIGLRICLLSIVLLGFLSISAAQGQRQPTSTRSGEPRAERIRRGNDLFQQFCQRCHGADGKGVSAKERLENLPNFMDSKWQEEQSDLQIRSTILEGASRQMPPFKDKMSEAEARELVVFIRKLAPTSDHDKEQPNADFSARFRELQEQVNELRNQYYKLSRSQPK